MSLLSDYVMLHALWPGALNRTEVLCLWIFEPATTQAPDFDPSDAVGFRDQVNREHWHVCEITQKGMASRGFEPGRYTSEEFDVHAFDVMVPDRYMERLAGAVEVGS